MSSNGDPQRDKNGSWISINEVKHERELRESKEQLLEERIDNVRELLVEYRTAAAKALELQAAEYERRLESLNHEHARAAEALRLTVSREIFDAFRAESQKDRHEIHQQFAKNEGIAEQDKLSRQRQTTALTVGLTVLSIIIGVIMRFIQ